MEGVPDRYPGSRAMQLWKKYFQQFCSTGQVKNSKPPDFRLNDGAIPSKALLQM